MSLISCENISLAYDKKTVLTDLSFQVNQGDYLCIVGENGSGKSTLMKAILGLVPTGKGRIVMGEGLSRRSIAYLPQQSAAQKDFPASVREVVLSGRLSEKRFFSYYTQADKAEAEASMKRLGILSLQNQSFRELSGGQQQRVLLARALSARMRLLMVDEPTNGLDPAVTAELYDIISQINKEGAAVIMVTHDIRSAVKRASHILHLQNKPLFWGTRDAYLISEFGKKYVGGIS